MPYNKVLIVVNNNADSMIVVQKGLELSQQLNATAALIYVIDTSRAIGSPDAGISSEQALIILKREAEQTLDELTKLYDGNAVIKMMPEGRPTREIVKAAVTWPADLIVIGVRDQSGLKRLLSGDLGEFISRHVKIPVLIVRLQ